MIGSQQTVSLSGTGQDFTISTNQLSATVMAGGTATFTLSIAPLDGFSQAVNLSCTDPATSSACAISPASVTPNGSTASTATVTITTTAPTIVPPDPPNSLPPGAWRRLGAPLVFWLIALAMLAATTAPHRHSHSREKPALSLAKGGNPRVPAPPLSRRTGFAGTTGRFPVSALLLLSLLLLLSWLSCGGAAAMHTPGTPAGNYTITLTATDPSASLTRTTTVNLTVKP